MSKQGAEEMLCAFCKAQSREGKGHLQTDTDTHTHTKHITHTRIGKDANIPSTQT
jgi:hypothetical protein